MKVPEVCESSRGVNRLKRISFITLRTANRLIPKATEDTITTLLKDALVQRNIKAELFPVVNTPVGIRKPDILCTNGGAYPLEAKFTERDLITAIAKVQNDYLKPYKLLNIKGGFAILYPEILSNPMTADQVKELIKTVKFKLVMMFPAEDPRPFKVFEGGLSQVAKLISEQVQAVPQVLEPSVDYIIRSLREAAMQLLTGFRHLTGNDLESFFGGEEVFRNILQYEEKKYPIEELKIGVAYLLVNQLLFYHAVSRFRTDFDTIDPDKLNSPSDLKSYFSRVLAINYKTIFSYDVASLLPKEFTEEVRTIVNVIQGVSPEKVGSDLLGTIFHDLIPFETRKNVAAFYTNVLAAELLATLSISEPGASVADFAVGSGGLLVAAYRRKKGLIEGQFTQELHRRFVEKDILGVDVMPFAANIAAGHLALQSPQFFTNKVRIAIWDSTDLSPKRVIPSVADLKGVLSGQMFIDSFSKEFHDKKGAVGISGVASEEIRLSPVDLVIMNPPFTRQERMPEMYKRLLHDRFKEYSEFINGPLGLYGYFVFLADKFLEKGGRAAFVLPAAILRVKSAEGLRKFIAFNYHVEHIITTWYRAAFSEATALREILFVISKYKDPKEPVGVPGSLRCTISYLNKLPETLKEARSFAEDIRSASTRLSSGDSTETKFLRMRSVSQEEIQANYRNLFSLIAAYNWEITELWSEIESRGSSN